MIAGLGTSPNLIQVNSLAVATTPPDRRTEAFSWIAAAAGVGIAAGSAITGLLVDTVGADAARIAVTAFGACPAVITVSMTLTGRRANR
jgi:predicted MFS family arabinose efflux permease